MASKAKINMQHGFMQSIIKNQVDRDNYDKEVKQKQAEQVAAVKQHKPEMPTYQPPNRRSDGILASSDTATEETNLRRLFEFQYEDQNGETHVMNVMKGDRAEVLARKFGREQNFNQAMTLALAELLRTEIRKAQNDLNTKVS